MSDDDEGITAVEAAGGEGVQLQRVQRAGVFTSQKQPEHCTADMRLFYLQNSPLLWDHFALESNSGKVFCLFSSVITGFQRILDVCLKLTFTDNF